MTKPLQGKIALVTGASRGIGRAAAIALGGAGAHVICVARTVGGLEETDDAIVKAGGSATLVPLNLKDFAAIDRLGASIHERWGRLDALLANGMDPNTPNQHGQSLLSVAENRGTPAICELIKTALAKGK